MTTPPMRTWWFIHTTGRPIMEQNTLGENIPAVDIGWVTSGRRSDLRQTSGYLGRPGGPPFYSRCDGRHGIFWARFLKSPTPGPPTGETLPCPPLVGAGLF